MGDDLGSYHEVYISSLNNSFGWNNKQTHKWLTKQITHKDSAN